MRKFMAILVTGIVSFLYYYLVLPPLSLASWEFWLWAILTLLCLAGVSVIFDEYQDTNWLTITSGICAAICLVVCVFGGIASLTIFHARSYQELLTVENGDFTSEISQIAIDQLPILDRVSAEKLGDRRMGEMADWVSQFEVSDDYTQINIANRPVRTSPLEYGGFFKWINNKANGVPAYIKLDMVTQEVDMVKFEGKGMKYVPSAFFGTDMMRHLRFNHPSCIFGESSFEVDDEGNPWYIVSVLKKKISMFGGTDVCGVILLNPINGDTTYYEVKDVPTWVDRVYSAEMITKHLNWYGSYKDGWWNAHIGQKGVLNCTQGYNYIAKDNDIWLYTGFTSVGKDESNVGFMLVNMRTKEARYYACPGAEEFSAMASAEGAVSNYRYSATFPLLINHNSEPTYLISLKDSASLIKMYALVNVTDYNIVSVGNTLPEAFSNYSKAILQKNRGQGIEMAENVKKTGIVAAVKQAVKDGNTYYYLMLLGDESIYIAPISVSDILPFIEENDNVTMEYIEAAENVKEVLTILK